jgi:hypothetical protein
MTTWNWKKETVAPDDILDAARTLPVGTQRILIDLTGWWTAARELLAWARSALGRGGSEGWDTAASLAKRAVCRQMDGILVHNHFGCFLGKNWKDKGGILARLDIPGLNLVRDLVIDPRNDIEHAYALATEEQAKRACDVAELFLSGTDQQAAIPAVLGLGWDTSGSDMMSTAPGREFHSIVIGLKKEDGPRLLITAWEEEHRVLVLYPTDEMLSICPLQRFSVEQILTLNARLRDCLKVIGSYSTRTVGPTYIAALKQQVGL